MAGTPTPQLAKDVYLRVRQKVTVGQCVYHLNNALQIVTAAGNFPWDVTTTTGTPAGDVIAVANMDTGKKVSCFSANGLPIVKITQDELQFAASNYLNVSATTYACFWIGQSVANPFLQFFPSVAPAVAVTYNYHQKPPTLVNLPSSTPRWTNSWMDVLLCDFAEMEIKRILGAPDAAELEQRCLARLKAAADAFSVERENSGPPGDVANAATEKNQIGRV